MPTMTPKTDRYVYRTSTEPNQSSNPRNRVQRRRGASSRSRLTLSGKMHRGNKIVTRKR